MNRKYKVIGLAFIFLFFIGILMPMVEPVTQLQSQTKSVNPYTQGYGQNPLSSQTSMTGLNLANGISYTYGTSTTNDYTSTWASDDVYHVSTSSIYSGTSTCLATGAPTYTYGGSQNALSFNGASNYVYTSDSSSLTTFTSGITFSLWIYFNSITSNQGVMSLSPLPYVDIWFDHTNGLRFEIVDSGSHGISFYSTTSVVAGQWYYVSMTYDSSSHTLTGYLNSTNVGSEVNTNVVFTSNPNPIYLGNYAGYLNGYEANVQIYSRALGQSEVTSDYNSVGGIPYSTSNLVLWYPMSEGSGATLYDNSNNYNNGVITGASWLTGQTWGASNTYTNTQTQNGVYQVSTSASYAGTLNQGANCGTGAQLASGTIQWTSYTNIQGVPDGVNSYASFGKASGTSYLLEATNFGFTIADGNTIAGIVVVWRDYASYYDASNYISNDICDMIKAGSAYGNNYQNGIWTWTSLTYTTYGSSSDLWGGSWTPADVRSAGFGNLIRCSYTYTAYNAGTAYVDSCQITVYYYASFYRFDYYYSMQFTLGTTVTAISWYFYGHDSAGNIKIYIANYAGGASISSWNDTTLTVPTTDASRTQGVGTSYMGSSGQLAIRFFLDGQLASFTNSIDYIYFTVSYTAYRIDATYTFSSTIGQGAVSSLNWTVEGKTSSATPVAIYIYNYQTSSWTDTTKTLTTTESAQTQKVTSAYVDANGNMKIRFYLVGMASSFTISIDYLEWKMTYTYSLSAVTLLSPANQTTLQTTIPTLIWQRVSGGINPCYYRIVISIVKTFASTVYNLTTINTVLQINNSMSIGLYYWKVKGIDAMGTIGAWSGIWQFTPTTSSTSGVSLVSPSINSVISNRSIWFKWSGNQVLDGDFEYGNTTMWREYGSAYSLFNSTTRYTGVYSGDAKAYYSPIWGGMKQPTNYLVNKVSYVSFVVRTDYVATWSGVGSYYDFNNRFYVSFSGGQTLYYVIGDINHYSLCYGITTAIQIGNDANVWNSQLRNLTADMVSVGISTSNQYVVEVGFINFAYNMPTGTNYFCDNVFLGDLNRIVYYPSIYQFELSNSITFSQLTVNKNTSGGGYVVDRLPSGNWYWRVRQLVTNTTDVGWSQTGYFSVSFISTLSLLSPNDNTKSNALTNTFSWSVPTNLLESNNPSFESADLWTYSNANRTSHYSFYGTWCGRVYISAGQIGFINQSLNINLNKSFIYSFAYATSFVSLDCYLVYNFAYLKLSNATHTIVVEWHSGDDTTIHHDFGNGASVIYIGQALGYEGGVTGGGGENYWWHDVVANLTSLVVGAGQNPNNMVISEIGVYAVQSASGGTVVHFDGVAIGVGKAYTGWYVSSYKLELSTTSTFLSPVIYTTTSTSYDVSSLNNLYYWRVRVLDIYGLYENYTSYRAFYVDSLAPDRVMQYSPIVGQTVTSNFNLLWNVTADNGIAGISQYNVELSTSNVSISDFNTHIILNTTTGILTRYVCSGYSVGTYYWKVRVIDNYTNQGAWSQIWKFFVGTSLVVVFPNSSGVYNPASFYRSDAGNYIFDFYVTYQNGTQVPIASLGSIVITLGSTSDSGNWNTELTYYKNRTINPNDYPNGIYTFYVDVGMAGFADGLSSKSFTVYLHQLTFTTFAYPSTTYQPNIGNFSFIVKSDGTGASISSFDLMTQVVDSTTANYSYTNGHWQWLANTGQSWGFSGTHTLTVFVGKHYYQNATYTITFTVSKFSLNIEWTVNPTQVYQSNDYLFSFKVRNGSANYFSDATITAYLDVGTSITFSYYGGAYNYIGNARSLNLGNHTIAVTVAKTYFTGTSSSKSFIESQYSLSMSWVQQPSNVYKPNNVTYSFTVNSTERSLYFDGVDDYVGINPTSGMTGMTSFSFSLWFYQMNQTGYRPIIDTGWAGYGTIALYTVGNIMVFGMINSSGVEADVYSYAVTMNVWHHIVGVWNGSYVYIYFDNMKSGSIALNGGTVSLSFVDIGRMSWLGEFKGRITNFMFWTRAISDSEQSYLDSNKQPQSTSQMVIYLPMNEGSGSTAYDLSGYSNNFLINYPTYDATWQQNVIVDAGVSAYRDVSNSVPMYYINGVYRWSGNCSSWSVGTHTLAVTVTKQYYSSTGDSKSFSILQYALNIYWLSQPPNVYQPNSITYKVKVNATGVSYFSDASVKGTLDGVTPLTLSWNGVDGYTITFDSISLPLGTHTVYINATRLYYSISWSGVSFGNLQHILSIPSIYITSSVYEPNNVSSYFNVIDELGHSFSNVTIISKLDDSIVSGMFTWSGSHYSWMANSTSIGIGIHTINVNVTLLYRQGTTGSASFTIIVHHFIIHWQSNVPSSVYKPNSITFYFNVSDELTPPNYFYPNAPLTCKIDTSPITFSWNGSQYVYVVQASQWLEGWHTLFVNVGSAYYASVNNTEAFLIQMHTLTIVWTNYPLTVYQPNSANFSYNVKDELNNYYGTGTVILSALLDNLLPETFNWRVASQTYNLSISTMFLTLNYHTLVAGANKQYYHNATNSVSFLVAWHQLSVKWVKYPIVVYQSQVSNFSLKVVDEAGVYYTGSSVVIYSSLDYLIPEVFVWQSASQTYNLTMGSLLSLNYHTLTVGVYKPYYNIGNGSVTFLVNQYHITVGGWTGQSTWYYPNAYTANFTTTNELGSIVPDLMTFTLDGIAYPLFSMTLTNYGSGVYGISVPIQSGGVNLWGVGTHTIVISAGKLGMAGGSNSYVFSLGYRSIVILYVGSSTVNYDYKMHNYTFRVTLDSHVTQSLLSWTMKIDGSLVTVHNYTKGSYLYLYATENETWGVHTLLLDVVSSSKNILETTSTAYVTIIAPNQLLPVIQSVPSGDTVQLWGEYEIRFYIEDNHGIIYKDATIVVSVYDSLLGYVVYQSSALTSNAQGLYDFKVSTYQLIGTGSYIVKVFISKTGWMRLETPISAFSVVQTWYDYIHMALLGITYVVGSGAFVSYLDERRKRQFGQRIVDDVFDFSGRRFTYPFLSSGISLIGDGILVWLAKGINIYTPIVIAIGIITLAMAVAIFAVWRNYNAYIAFASIDIGLGAFAIYYSYEVLKLGMVELGLLAPFMLTAFYLIINSIAVNSGLEKKWIGEVIFASKKDSSFVGVGEE